MATTVPVEAVKIALATLFEEIMEQVNGYVLDKGTSMFETLATITAEEASRPVSRQSATLAAQVNHLRFYMESILAMQENADWASSWRVVAVTEAEWRDLIAGLRSVTEQVRGFIGTFDDWNETFLGGAIGIIVHCAYHLGEIRQGIGVIRDPA
jgi:hypothetical protein